MKCSIEYGCYLLSTKSYIMKADVQLTFHLLCISHQFYIQASIPLFLVPHLIIPSYLQVSKVKAQECSIYEGCNQCLGARDPYCGWCSLENKCSLRRDCRDATQDPQHWVSYKTGRCTTITQVMPDKLQRTTARTVCV